MVLGIFKIALPFERLTCFYVTIGGNFERFQYLTLKQILLKTKTFFKKLKRCFLVESTKIENTSFPYKTTTSEANIKTNRMVSTKNGVFPVTTLFFGKFCFSLRTSYKELI